MLNQRSIPQRSAGVPLAAVSLCVLLILFGAGCTSLSGPGSASFASVTIADRTQDQIVAAATQVFTADGYFGGQNGPGRMVFEREASRGTTLAREGFMNTQAGAQTINRVRAEIVPLGGNQFRLQCKAYMVTGGSDPFFQEESALSHMRRLPYQNLLDKVKKQLE
jgi:hypothetical protein